MRVSKRRVPAEAGSPKAKLFLLGLLLLGCGNEPTAPAAEVAPTLTEVTAERTDLMFRYRDEAGAWQTVSVLAEVPASARAAVQVVDLSRSPQERAAGRFVQVFDLRAVGPEGRYLGQLVPRDELEQALAAAHEAARPVQAAVTMYSASWCGVCRKARSFMEEKGIAFVEKDIEKDREAAGELSAKAKRAGIQAGGVPVFDVGGRMLSGFDPEALLQAIAAPPQAARGG